MKKVKIKSIKQSNGLWGTPINCYKINGSPPKDHDLNILASAILIAIDEQYNIKFSVKYMDYTEDGFYVILTDEKIQKNKLLLIKYDICLLEDNTIIYFESVEEKNNYLRKHKIKKIMNKNG